MKFINTSTKRVIALIFGVALIVFVLIQIDTNEFMEEVEEAFLSMDYYVNAEFYADNPEVYSDPNVNYVIYTFDYLKPDIKQKFNRASHTRGDAHDDVTINLKLNRILTIHNFFDGYIWFCYEVKYFDKSGNDVGGSIVKWPYPVKMKIHKENGKWKVIQIWERP